MEAATSARTAAEPAGVARFSAIAMSVWFENPQRQTAYLAQSKLGEGGFGSVWSGTTACAYPVAIKVIKPTGNVERESLPGTTISLFISYAGIIRTS